MRNAPPIVLLTMNGQPMARWQFHLLMFLSCFLTSCIAPYAERGVENTKGAAQKAKVWIWTSKPADPAPEHDGHCWKGTHPCGARQCCNQCRKPCGW